jgi:NhaP-type Na+/H+ or K+/H+ antiporter
MFCQPFLFGTVGAAVQFKDIDVTSLGPGIGVIFIGLTCRWLGAFLAMMEPKYTVKEKAFVAFGWIPKATVQAALGGVTIAEARKTGDPTFIKNGKEMLTMAVFAICITAPLGAILIATLGKRWLKYDEEFDTTKNMGEQVEDKEVTQELVAVTNNNSAIDVEAAPADNSSKKDDSALNQVAPQ